LSECDLTSQNGNKHERKYQLVHFWFSLQLKWIK
jgi:hypothetical protein